MKKYIQKIMGVFLILKYNVDQVKSLKEILMDCWLFPPKNLRKELSSSSVGCTNMVQAYPLQRFVYIIKYMAILFVKFP